MKTMFLLSAVLLAVACGGGKKDPDANLVRIDSRPQIDAPITVTCTAPGAGYGSPVIPATDQAAVRDTGGTAGDETDDVVFATALLNQETDIFQLQLYAGFGVFPGAVAVGTYPLTGEELNYATCGVCPLIFSDTMQDAAGMPDNSLDDPNRNYFPVSGSVTITSLTPNLTGTIDNLMFEHVLIDGAGGGGTFNSTVVGDCQSSITSMAFDAPITEQKPSRPGEPAPLVLNLRRTR